MSYIFTESHIRHQKVIYIVQDDIYIHRKSYILFKMSYIFTGSHIRYQEGIYIVLSLFYGGKGHFHQAKFEKKSWAPLNISILLIALRGLMWLGNVCFCIEERCTESLIFTSKTSLTQASESPSGANLASSHSFLVCCKSIEVVHFDVPGLPIANWHRLWEPRKKIHES